MTSDNKVVAVIAECLMKDMANSHDLQIQLTKSIAFDEGYASGYEEGFVAAQRNMRRAMVAVDVAAGNVYKESDD